MRARAVGLLILLAGIIGGWLVSDSFKFASAARMMAVVLLVLGLILVAGDLVRVGIGRRRDLNLRGIHSAGLESISYRDLNAVWAGAAKEVVAIGLGMSRLSRNPDLVREAVKRGVRVKFCLTDPDWLSANVEVVATLASFYDTDNILGKNRDSFDRLCRLRDELNAAHGAGKVTVVTYQSPIMMSATVADPDTVRARGVVEFHLFQAGDKRFRLDVRGYRQSGDEKPLLSQVIDSIFRALTYKAPTQVASVPMSAVAVVTKAPEPMHSKTRLLEGTDSLTAELILGSLLRMTVSNSIAVGCPTYCFSHGNLDATQKALVGMAVTVVDSHVPNHLTALCNATRHLLENGHTQAIVVASDAPTADPSLIRDALAKLADTDCVIIPSTDGGICALATRRVLPDLPESWSSNPDLQRRLCDLLIQHGWKVELLPTRTDVDDRQSLVRAVSETTDCLQVRQVLQQLCEFLGADTARIDG